MSDTRQNASLGPSDQGKDKDLSDDPFLRPTVDDDDGPKDRLAVSGARSRSTADDDGPPARARPSDSSRLRSTVDDDDDPPPRVADRDAPIAPFGRSRRRSMTRRLVLGTGTTIPGTPYRLVRWLGDGGMGAVFEATHVDIERRVAVKLLHAHSSREEWIVKGFRNEARISARISFPNIVEIYDFKELADGRLLIAMEFLDGPTLREIIDRCPLTFLEIIGLVRQICRGLGAAHAAGIIHRDIKPENIMLIEREGRRGFVKLLDFGVAQFLRDESTTCAVGTAEYMAPESACGLGDHRADVYALGCLLFELLTRETPFNGETAEDIIQRHLAEDPVAPSSRAPDRNIPTGLDAVVLRCLAKEASERYGSMAELEADLLDVQIEQRWKTPWDDLPVPEVGRTRRAELEIALRALARSRRKRRWWRAPTLAFGLGVATVAITLPLLARDESAEQRALEEIDTHVNAARAAAARFYFVYPSPDDPQGPTAFKEVLALEELGSEEARRRSAQLRDEFADTLVRLGDRYWDFNGARPFAFEYYHSALAFAPHPRALSRVSVPSGMLEQMRERAASGDFSPRELSSVQPLVALAEPDAEVRNKKLEALRDRAPSPWIAASIDQVLHGEGEPPTLARRDVGTDSSSSTDSTSGSTMTTELEPAVDPLAELEAVPLEDLEGPSPASTPTSEESPSSATPRSRTTPTRSIDGLLRQARAARREGRVSDAETLYNRALAANHRSLAALDGLAGLAFSDARYGDAVDLLERAVEHGPRSARRWLALGDAYFKTLRYSHASDAYARAQQLGSGAAAGRLEKVQRRLGSP